MTALRRTTTIETVEVRLTDSDGCVGGARRRGDHDVGRLSTKRCSWHDGGVQHNAIIIR